MTSSRVVAVLSLLLLTPLFAADAGPAPKAFSGPDAPFSAPRLDAWKVIGPGGGGAQYYPTISPLDPKQVLVRCDMTGTYLTEDGGETWRMFNGRTTASFFVFDPVDTNTIYCNRLGLLRSTDSGKTWNLVFPDPESVKSIRISGDHGEESFELTGNASERIGALAIDPADSRTLYIIGTSGGSVACYVSTDWGKTWRKAGDLPNGGAAIYIDPKSPKDSRTICIVGRSGVSVRKGGAWTHNKPAQGISGFGAATAGFSPGDGAFVVYALTGGGGRRGGGTAGIYRSADSGVTWDRVDADLAAKGSRLPALYAIATCLTNPNVVYVSYNGLSTDGGNFMGVAKTSDAGKTWQLVWKESDAAGENMRDAWMTERFGPGWGDNPRYLGVAPTNPDMCFGTDDGRTMRTTNGGKTWEGVYSKKAANGDWSTTGIDVTTCYGVHFDPFDKDHIFISYTDIGLFESFDRGATWRSATAKGVPGQWTNTTYWMVFDPEVKGRAWGVMSSVHDIPRPKMWRSGMRQQGGVCVSEDGGSTWKVSTSGMPQTNATHIILDPKSPKDSRTLYVAGFGTGVWKSTDGGASWTLKNKGIKGEGPFAWRFAMDPKGVLYLIVARRTEEGEIGDSGDGALYRSADGAETWTEVTLPRGANGPNGLAIDPKEPNRLYLAAWGRVVQNGSDGGGIFLSTDAGKSWKSILSRD